MCLGMDASLTLLGGQTQVNMAKRMAERKIKSNHIGVFVIEQGESKRTLPHEEDTSLWLQFSIRIQRRI